MHTGIELMNIMFSIWHYIGFGIVICIILVIIVCSCKIRLRALTKKLRSNLATKSGKSKLWWLSKDPKEMTVTEMVPMLQTTSGDRSTLDRETTTEAVMPSAPKLFIVNHLYPSFEDTTMSLQIIYIPTIIVYQYIQTVLLLLE